RRRRAGYLPCRGVPGAPRDQPLPRRALGSELPDSAPAPPARPDWTLADRGRRIDGDLVGPAVEGPAVVAGDLRGVPRGRGALVPVVDAREPARGAPLRAGRRRAT